MIDHLGLRVRDLAASVRFYKAVLAPLGYVLDAEGEGYAGFGPKGAAALWLHPAGDRPVAGMHVAFTAKDHDAVGKFHAAGIKAGGKDNGAPGLRPNYTPTYYAAFLIDPDGNNVEAVCM